LRKDDPAKAEAVIRDLAYVVRDLAVLIEPYMPQAAAKIASFFGLTFHGDIKPSIEICWKNIGRAEGIADNTIIISEVLFAKLEDELVETLRERYSGSQKERQADAAVKPAFAQVLDLRVAIIEKIEKHPKADKLYIVGLEIGQGITGVREERTIVSGLVPFYKEEELLGKRIIVAYNLKPTKLRGIESRGMLLAAGDNKGTGEAVERCEVLDATDCPTGTRLLPEGEQAADAPPEIDIDAFFSVPIAVKDFVVQSNGKNLCLDGKPVRTSVIPEGEVH
jgi:methionyl-tRNA synthetase